MIQQDFLKVKQFFEQNNRFKALQCQNSNDYWKLINSSYFLAHPDNYKQVQINCNSLTQAMAFDIDHDDPLLFQDFGLPQPSILTINADNGKSHII